MIDPTWATVIAIEPLGDAPAIDMASTELSRYLNRMLPPGEGALRAARGDVPTDARILRLGTFQALDDAGVDHAPWPTVADIRMDDAVAMAVEDGAGYIGGPNPRSVLLGVYRFLREQGCAWVRPGAGGERLSRCTIAGLSAQVREAASYRHRAICIEGAVSYDNVASIIDWAPKVGMNGYFTQFRESYIFFERWYAHRNNPLKITEPFSVERARDYMAGIVSEITRRDLLYHAVGHGWTCEPLGMAGLGWDAEAPELSPEVTGMLAEVNGVRSLWHGVPLNTNLCYSNPAVREMVVGSMVEYLAEHREVDLLHFWLADGSNNQCECPRCRNTRPADYYVMMLNALDRALAERGIDTRIVFLVYVDLLWPPERERIANPERFVLMFAPITRSYRETFATADESPGTLPPYERNRLTFPSDPAQNVAFLRAWQEAFGGDSFDFDYHLWRGHYMDPGHLDIARVLGQDIGSLATIGLNGYVSCQVQRAFFPTNVPMQVMAARLWDRDADLDAIEAAAMQEAYGADAYEAKGYLHAVTEAFRELEPLLGAVGDEAALPPLDRMATALERVRGAIARNLQHEDPCVAQSWLYLDHHRRLLGALAPTLEARARGEEQEALRAWGHAEHYLQANEDALQPVLDVWGYLETMRRRLGYDGPKR